MFSKKKNLIEQLTPADGVAGALLALGALNWALVGTANFDAIRAVLGRTAVARAAYGLIGASAAYALVRGRHLSHS